MAIWTFFDMMNSKGESVIKRDLDSFGPTVKAEINTRIQYLQTEKSFDPRDVKRLKGKCRGLLELRIKVNNVHYRPLGFYGLRQKQVTLVMVVGHKDNKFVPPDACETALARKKKIEQGNCNVCEHRFD